MTILLSILLLFFVALLVYGAFFNAVDEWNARPRNYEP